MGAGIAEVAASHGHPVLVYDINADAISRAIDGIRGRLESRVARGKLGAHDAEQTLQRLVPVTDIHSLAVADLVIEAASEQMAVKKALFTQLAEICPAKTLLTSNTSSISITAIAADLHHPERVAGLHFFNPAPVMKLVEVVRGERSDPQVIERLIKLAEEAGHFPAITPDTPGFLVNHAGRAYSTEAQRILAEGIADAEQIDRILRDGPGFRMGPFELLDLTGLDVSHAVMESVYQQFYQDPRYTPSYQAAQRVAAGLLGRKSGQGYYRYDNGQQMRTPAPALEPVSVDRPFWLDSQDAELRGWLAALLGQTGAQLESGETPSERAICLITPLGEDASSMIARLGLPAARCVAYDLFSDRERRHVLMRTPALDPALEAQARQALGGDGVPVEVINDSPGFVSQRVVASIINLGCEIAQKGIADPHTLDRAITLALGYPKGPLGFAEHYGAARVLAILEAMQACYGGEARYRPSPWLRRRVQLALPLSAPERASAP